MCTGPGKNQEKGQVLSDSAFVVGGVYVEVGARLGQITRVLYAMLGSW